MSEKQPWDDDITAILTEAIKSNGFRGTYTGASRAAIEHAIVGSPGAEIRTLLARAWQAGHAAGNPHPDKPCSRTDRHVAHVWHDRKRTSLPFEFSCPGRPA